MRHRPSPDARLRAPTRQLSCPQDIVKPCIRALNALLRNNERWFQSFRQLHKGSAENIAAAIRAACETLHRAGAPDRNQKMLRADVRNALSLVQVRVQTLI